MTLRLSRREALKLGSGMLIIGGGLAVIASAAPASAGSPSSLELHFFKKDGGGFSPIGSVQLPAALLAKLQAADVEHVRLSWHRQAGQQKVQLAEHALPAAKQLAAAFAKKQK